METNIYVQELEEMTSAFKKQPQYIGFNHKFYVPGWIGFIQSCIVERKMEKAAKNPIYKNLGYYECADHIIELVSKACEFRKNSVSDFEKDNDNPENMTIVIAASNVLEAWINIYPEIAYWMNKKIGDNHVTNAVGIIESNFNFSLSEIVNIPAKKATKKSEYSFGQEMKTMGYQLAGWFCNMILFALIFGLLGAIFN